MTVPSRHCRRPASGATKGATSSAYANRIRSGCGRRWGRARCRMFAPAIFPDRKHHQRRRDAATYYPFATSSRPAPGRRSPSSATRRIIISTSPAAWLVSKVELLGRASLAFAGAGDGQDAGGVGMRAARLALADLRVAPVGSFRHAGRRCARSSRLPSVDNMETDAKKNSGENPCQKFA